MNATQNFLLTRQGVRDLDHPTPRRSGRDHPLLATGAPVNVGTDEQSASAIGGAVLAGLGLGWGGLPGLALAAVGGALLFRGATGHCAAYAAAGINTAS